MPDLETVHLPPYIVSVRAMPWWQNWLTVKNLNAALAVGLVAAALAFAAVNPRPPRR